MRFFVRSTHLVTSGLSAAVFLVVATCYHSRETRYSGVIHYSGKEFAGSSTCVRCHPVLSNQHRETAHALTSSIATEASVKGSFDSGRNVFHLGPRVQVVMQRTDTGLVQRGFIDGQRVVEKRIDLVIGSGKKGQSYLYWQDNSLFQLPVSYHTPSDSWTNSPGYPATQLVFDRNIPARCLECHSTFIRIGRSVGGNETFVPDQLIAGINCERCHGPAADHVSFHEKYPSETEGRFVVNPARLTRKQKLDNCALCHSGLRENIMPSSSYLVGEDLDRYSYASTPPDRPSSLDVHGNQYGLLAASKCFQFSEMDCSSCHDVHRKETGASSLFSTRCMSCHQPGSARYCTQPVAEGLDLTANCIDCHMPLLPSRQIVLRSADETPPTPFYVRTHQIGIYDDPVKAFLEKVTSQDTLHTPG